jgi:hypothetical protein
VDDLDDLGGRQSIHSALRGDIELVSRYGDEHPGTWAGVWFDNEPTVCIVAAFTSDVAQHEAALRPRLRHPTRLVVQRMPHSLADLRRVRAEIERTLRQRAAETGRPVFTSIGEGKAVIHLDLRADQENMASELAARYGSAVELRVGFFGFPGRGPARARPPVQPAAEESEEKAFDGLEMSLEVDQTVLEVGDDGRGRLVLRNHGQDRIVPQGLGQPLVGSLLNANQEVVGGFCGAIGGTGLVVDLAPGDSTSIWVLFGTASIREELGYALPPGTYWLRVQVSFRHGPGERTYALTAPLTQITVVPRVREIGEEAGPSRGGDAAGSHPGPAGRD